MTFFLPSRTTEKSCSDKLTSGRKTSMPLPRTSATFLTTLSVSSLSQVSRPAKNSSGK